MTDLKVHESEKNESIDLNEDNMDNDCPPTTAPVKSIKAIDKTTVHRICSGQVVLTLATAVKELVENSIDAGATCIEIRLKEYGSSLIEISDNGKGVEPCDFEGLTLKHHTSKLQDFDDLIGVKTFGFRGEALSSLCALSDLTVITRHGGQTIGTKLTYNTNGKLSEKTPVSRQVGTTVTLSNIFYTLPVRHKEFLRNLKKEFHKMVQVLYSYCLITTNVRILATNQCGRNAKTTIVSTESQSSLKENISSIFGPKQVLSLLELRQRPPDEQVLREYGIDDRNHLTGDQNEPFRMEGFVSSCAHGKGRSAADRQFYFINQRPCDPSKVARVVNEVYHHYNRHQFPMVVLNIQMKEDDVDVNVTPDKRQIMVNKEHLLLATIKATLICLYENIPAFVTLQNPTLQRLHASSPKNKEGDVPESLSPILGSSLAERFSHTSSSSPKPGTSPRFGQAKKLGIFSASFGGIKRTLASHSEFQATVKQPKLQDFRFTMNGRSPPKERLISNGVCNTEEDITTVKDARVPQNGSIFNDEGVIGSDSEQRERPVTSNHDTETPDEESSLALLLDLNDSHSFPKSREVHSKTEAFLSSLKKGMSNTTNGGTDNEIADREIHAKTEAFLSSLKKGRSFTTNTETANENGVEDITGDLEDVSEHHNEEVSIIYDDDVSTTKPTPTAKGKSLTVPFSLESLRLKLELLGKQRKPTTSGRDQNSFRKFRAKIAPSDNTTAEEELKKEISKHSFPEMKVIGQFNLGFVIAHLEPDLFIIDQHATDEKYNFECLQKTCVLQRQKLISPQRLELTPSNEGILLDNKEIFAKNGFEFDVDLTLEAGRRVSLVSMPHSRGWEFTREDVEEMIFMLSDSPGVMCRPSRVNAMFASRSCRKAVMIGTSLDHANMRKLIDHMSEMDQPWNCPHGRPTIRHLVNLDLLAKLEL